MRLAFNDLYRTMPWDEIDTVVFDVGNVLMHFDPMEVVADCVPDEPELHPMLVSKVIRSPYWLMLDHGTVTVEEAIEGMIGQDKHLEKQIRQTMNGWIDLKQPIAEGVAALKKCKAMGKKLYVLSNYHDAAFEHVWNKYDFFRLFDGLVVSSRVKMLKPNPDIYRCMVEKFALDPQKTLFIDDTSANVEGALEAGWQAICYNRSGVLSSFFEISENPQALEI